MPHRISHLLASLTMVLSLALVVAAQSNFPAACPRITVTGPAGIPDDGLYKFRAKVEGDVSDGLEYKWAISIGQMIEGQGTAQITVWNSDINETLVASVEISPLPKGCPTSASEAASPRETVPPILIDEVEQPITNISEQTLRAAAEEQENNPSHKLYIVAYFTKDVSEFDVRRAVKKVTDFFIKEMKLTNGHFEIETVRSETNAVKIYRLPPGAERPRP